MTRIINYSQKIPIYETTETKSSDGDVLFQNRVIKDYETRHLSVKSYNDDEFNEQLEAVKTYCDDWTVEEIVPTPKELRSEAYGSLTHDSNDKPLFVWEGEPCTVNKTVELFNYYNAEGNEDKMAALQIGNNVMKTYIRALYPD